MVSTSETSQGRNLARFAELITNCSDFGESYQPSRETIKLAGLQSLYDQLVAAVGTEGKALVDYKNATNEREASFKGLGNLATRIFNSIDSSEASPLVVNDVRSLVNKIRGSHRRTKKNDQPEEPPAGNEPEPGTEPAATPVHHSTSHMSYDVRLENFMSLIRLLESQQEYSPNEPELKIPSLNQLYGRLMEMNAGVIRATSAFGNAHIAINFLFRDENKGLNAVARDVKKYVKSAYGATSPQYRKVSSISIKG